MSVRPISSTFQQMGGIRHAFNESSTGRRYRWCKEECDTVIIERISIWVKDKAFNGRLTTVDDQRGRIEVLGAIRIKEEGTRPLWNIVPQDIFGIDLFMDMNQIWVFIYKPPQALSI